MAPNQGRRFFAGDARAAVFVEPLEDAMRIRTGERVDNAV
jgi:nitrogen regulatory protein PII